VERLRRRAGAPGAGPGAPRPPIRAWLGRALLALACVAAAGCGADPAPAVSPAAAAETQVPFRFFSASSFWNTELPTDAALDPSSAASIGALRETVADEMRTGDGPWINTSAYSVPIYTVSARQPDVTVHLRSTARDRSLAAAWRAVPLPPGARPARGTDGILVVWQPSHDRLWEFWRLSHGASGWQAAWGGAMRHVQAQSGVYGPHVWPGAQRAWGVSASSLSLVGGLISLQQLKFGRIEHALEMAVPAVRAGVYASPAQRTDGVSPSPLSLPEGAHLRLNPSLDLAALHLPPLTLMLAQAAQRYGIFVTDTSPVVEFYAQDPTPSGDEPYRGAGGYFGGATPSQLLSSFPWSELQLLAMSLHRSRTRSRT
jgi:hypothetical protein